MSHSPEFSESYWQEHYQTVNRQPSNLAISPHLNEIANLQPGNALDAGCGEGTDAIWLSKQGWNVKAVDISSIALDRAKELARSVDAHVDFEQVNLTAWSPEKDYYDLVISQYVHTTDNQKFIKALVEAVKLGGTLLIVGHQPPKAHEISHNAEGSHVTTDEIVALLSPKEWEVQIAEARTTERLTHSGKTVVLYDSLLKARKRMVKA